jgi:hypothetical protein
MGYHPAAFDPLVTHRRTPPHLKSLPIHHRGRNPVEAVAKGRITACHDAQVANLEADWTVEGGEPLLDAFFQRI